MLLLAFRRECYINSVIRDPENLREGTFGGVALSKSHSCFPSYLILCVIWVCLLPCRHPRTTNESRGNLSNKKFGRCSHLEVRVATWMCQMHFPQAPTWMFRRLTLRFSRFRPEKTLQPTLHALQQIARYQVSKSVSFIIQGFEHTSFEEQSDLQPSLFTGSSTSENVTSTSTFIINIVVSDENINYRA